MKKKTYIVYQTLKMHPLNFFVWIWSFFKILNIQKSLLILLSWEKKVFNFKNASEKTS